MIYLNEVFLVSVKWDLVKSEVSQSGYCQMASIYGWWNINWGKFVQLLLY